MIYNFEDYINELWTKGLTRNKNGEERIEDVLGDHSFTDGNGKFHKYGIKVESRDELIDVCCEIIEKNINKPKIDLNVIDVSEVNKVSYIFETIYDILKDKSKIDTKNNSLPLDTSGWVFNNCKSFFKVVTSVNNDIGVNNWKINKNNKDVVELEDFENSYYENHVPDWWEFDIHDYIGTCVGMDDCQYDVDKELTKKLGKKSYEIIFESYEIYLPFIPDNVVIKDVYNGGKSMRTRIDASKLTSLKRLPKKFTSDVILDLNLDIITDDEITIPENVLLIRIFESSKIQKLPQDMSDISLTINNEYKDRITSLKGCPKKIGNFRILDVKNITNLIGSPEETKLFYIFGCNKLISLKGCPKIVNGNFELVSCPKITCIDDFPEYVMGDVILKDMNLNDFKGLPNKINGNLYIDYCKVKSLEGLPNEIKGKLICHNSQLNRKWIEEEDIKKIYPNIKNIDVE